ncbi:TrbI/VirB10 family protein [uncultured Thiodictyon sp.]|uniref:TrbI/VirB10 family protein n=1 Tax=uncultured Thiodictyon sp. TaxID=1846217 RepID=UPI0025FE9A75|nr:TrbI/VirB10 family protein [uncultured Thiodictyon sp.]
MSLKTQWNALSPKVQRWAMFAAAGGGLFALAALSVSTVKPLEPAATPQERLVRNLLTDTDPRTMGVEGLATRLARMEKHVDDLNDSLALSKKATDAAAASPGDPAALDQRLAMDELKAEVAALRQQLDAAKQAPTVVTPPSERVPGRPAEPLPVVPAPVPVPPRQERPIEQMFTRAPSPTLPEAVAPAGARAMDIRVVTAAPPKVASGPTAAAKDALFIPAGTILRGVFLNGMDAPTGQGARTQPTPALIRIKAQAILPNRFRADVKECFVIVGGFGDLGSERAYLRSETLTCVRTDGGVIEVPIDGYAVGEDGKVGVRGRLVSKQGTMLANAMQAGFLQSFAKVFTQVPTIPLSAAGAGSQMQFQSMFSPQAAESAVAGGVGGAMEKLADFYMRMADQTFPVLEVDAGRAVELILNKGVSLRLSRDAPG